MKLIISLFVLLISAKCKAQDISIKGDTLLKKERVTLLLYNGGFAIPPFSVSGDIYLTHDYFIFHPKPYHGKKYERFNDLVKDLVLPYDHITLAKRNSVIFGGLRISTKEKTYKIEMASTIKQACNKKLKETVALINRLGGEYIPKKI